MTKAKKNKAKFKVASEMLVSALSLPEGTKLLGIESVPDMDGVYHFIVEHVDIPEKEGEEIPEIVPVLKSEMIEKITWHWTAEAIERDD
jgi:hypothetical protein